MNEDKLGVLYIVAHLIITIAIIVAYVYMNAIGEADKTLELALIAIIGYWFGAMDKANIKSFAKSKKNKDVA